MQTYGGTTSWWDDEEEEQSPEAPSFEPDNEPVSFESGMNYSGTTEWWSEHDDTAARDFDIPSTREPDLSAYPIQQTEQFGYERPEEPEAVETPYEGRASTQDPYPIQQTPQFGYEPPEAPGADPALEAYISQQETGGEDEDGVITGAARAMVGFGQKNIDRVRAGISSPLSGIFNFIAGGARAVGRAQQESLEWEQKEATDLGDSEKIKRIDKSLSELRTKDPGQWSSTIASAFGEMYNEGSHMPDEGFVAGIQNQLDEGDLLGVADTLAGAVTTEGPRLLVTALAYKAAGPGGALVSAYMQEGGAAYEEFGELIAEEEDRFEAASLYATGASVLEFLPVTRIFHKWGISPTTASRGVLSWLLQGALEGGTERMQEKLNILIGGEYADDAEAYLAQDQTGRLNDATAIGALLGLVTGIGDVPGGFRAQQKTADETVARIENQRRDLEANMRRIEGGMGVAGELFGQTVGGMADTIEGTNLVTQQARENAEKILVQREELEAGISPEEIAQRGELRKQGLEVPSVEEAIMRRDMEELLGDIETQEEALMPDEELRMKYGGETFENREPIAELPEQAGPTVGPTEDRGLMFPVTEPQKQLPEGREEREIELPPIEELPEEPAAEEPGAIPLGPSPVEGEIEQEAVRQEDERVYEGEFEEVTRALPAAGPERFTVGAAVQTPKGFGVIQKVFKNGKIRVKGIGVFSPDEIELAQATPLGPAPEKPVQEPPREVEEREEQGFSGLAATITNRDDPAHTPEPEALKSLFEDDAAGVAENWDLDTVTNQDMVEAREQITARSQETLRKRYPGQETITVYRGVTDEGDFIAPEADQVISVTTDRQTAEGWAKRYAKQRPKGGPRVHEFQIPVGSVLLDVKGVFGNLQAFEEGELLVDRATLSERQSRIEPVTKRRKEETTTEVSDPPAEKVFAPPEEVEAAPKRPAVEIPETQLGPTVEKTTPEGTEFEVQWAVVDAADPIVSHDLEGKENPEFPQEKQQRDRGSKASQEWLRKTSEKVDPEQLLDSRVANTGAPILDPSMVTESGNQRMRLIRTVYGGKRGSKQKGGATKYRARVKQKAKELGIKIPKGMKNPVLVFIRRGEGDAVKLTREMNVPSVAEMGTAERAATDAEKITTKALAQINPTATGEINMANSGEFVREFVNNLPENERANMMDKKGNLSAEGLKRVRNAVLVKAFGKSETLNSLLEDTDSNVKRVGRAMVIAAPHIAALQEKIKAGDAVDMDPASEINEALQAIAAIRKQNLNVEDKLSQESLIAEQGDPLVNALVGILGGAKSMIEKYGLGNGIHNSAERMGKLLIRYTEIAGGMSGAKQDVLFEGLPEASKLDVLESATKDFESVGQEGIDFEGKPGEMRGTVTAKTTPGEKGKKGGKAPAAGKVASIRMDNLLFPESIAFVKKLLGGKYPRVMKLLKGVRGRVRYKEGDRIVSLDMNADTATDEAVALILWHEIGHVIDMLPNSVLKRGNILGHIAALKRYQMTTMAKAIDNFPDMLTKDERKAIYAQAKKDKVDPQKAIDAELDRRGLVSKKQVMDELVALSEAWRGKIPREAGKERTYRMSPSELYADAVSVLVNDEAYMQKNAPLFYGMFHSYMANRPAVLKHYIAFVEQSHKFRKDRIEDLDEVHADGMRQGRALRGKQMLEKYKNKTIGFRQVLRDFVDGLIEKKGDVYRRVKAEEKKGRRLNPEVNPIYWLEESSYVSGLQRAYMADVQAEVLDPLEVAGIDSVMLGQLMGYARAATERSQIHNPMGIGGELAREFYIHNKNKLTEAQWAMMRGSIKALWNLRQEYVTKTVEEYGALSPEMTKKIVENPFYARFTALELIEAEEKGGGLSGPSSALKHQTGMLSQIGDPVLETLLIDTAMIRWLHHNQATRYAVEFLVQSDPKNVKKAKRGPGGRVVATNDPDMQTVSYKKGGKTVAYDVPKEFAKAIGKPEGTTMLHLWYNKWVVTPQRWAFVQYNPGFAYYNIFRDSLRAYVNVYKGFFKGDFIGPFMKMAKYYAMTAGETWRYTFGNQHGITKTSRKMAKEKSLISERAATEGMGPDTDLDGTQILFEHFNVHGGAMAQEKGGRTFRGALTALGRAIKTGLGGASEYTERWSKFAAHRYLEESGDYSELSPQERAQIVRGEAGTPDPYRRGKWHNVTNAVFLFSNISKEGSRADWTAMKRDPINWWVKQSFVVGGVGYGSMYLSAFLAAGGDDEEMRRMLDKIPEHYKGKYFIVVWGKDEETGKTRFSGIPLPWTAQIMGAMLHMGMNADEYSYQDYLKELTDFLPWGGASINPALQAGWGALTYATGGNPTDQFTNRPAIPRDVQEAGGSERHKAFWKWFWYKGGGGTLTRYEFSENEDLSWWQKWTPAGPMQRRFLKETDYGLEEDLIGLRKKDAKIKARKKGLRTKTIKEVLELKPKATAEYVQQQLEQIETRDFPDGIAYSRIGDLRRRLADLRLQQSKDAVERAKGYERTTAGRERIEEHMEEKEKYYRGED